MEKQRRKPGPKPRGNEFRVWAYLTAEEHQAFIEACKAEGVSQAEAIRQGIRWFQRRSERRRK